MTPMRSQGNGFGPRVNVLGVGVSAINMDQALAAIERWTSKREANYVCITNIHGIIESQRDRDLRRIHNTAGLVTPDGMPLVWLLRGRGIPNATRVYGPDLMTLRARLEPFAGALAAGRTLTVDEALDEALADAPRSPRSVALIADECDIAARPASR